MMSSDDYGENLFTNLTTTDDYLTELDSNESSLDFNQSFGFYGPAHCGSRLENDNYRFWLDGVIVAVVGLIGFVGNLLALIVLSRRQLQDVFHQLLFALACFDILFLIFGGISYTFRAFQVSTDLYTYLFPYLVHPMSHVAMAGTIFMTLAISIERYLGLCHPFFSPHSRKAWMYILPVVIVSVALNVPKFFEITVRMEFDNSTGLEVPTITNTDLRHKKHYILGYVMWTRLFSTAVIPVSLLVYLNLRIIIDLMQSTKVKRFGSTKVSRKEMNLSIVLLCIVVIFFCCHAARIILDIYEFINIDKIMDCRPYAWWPPHEMQILVFFSHLLMILNSSVNFVVYCLVGHTFRREMCRAFGLRKYKQVPGGGLSRRSSRNDYSMAAISYAPVANTTTGYDVTDSRKKGSVVRFSSNNGNVPNSNNGTNSVRRATFQVGEDSSSGNVVVLAVDSPISGNNTVSIHETKELLVVEENNEVEDSLLCMDKKSNDSSEKIVTTCLIENFSEKKNAIYV